jgi:hypothetical protein
MNLDNPEASPATDTAMETGPAPVDTQDQALAAPGVTADPPSADEKPARSLLDVVSDAVKTEPEAAEGTSASEGAEAEPASPAEESPELSEEDLAKLPFGKHPRFKQVIGERNEARQKLQELEAKASELEAPAEQFRRIDAFLVDSRIENEEFVRLMQVGRLIKNDPEAALKVLYQVVGEVRESIGDVLPQDLRNEIEEGRISEDRARELSRTRAAQARATEAAERAEAERRRGEETTQTQVQQGRIINAVAVWETEVKLKDPDYARKESFVADRVAALNGQLGMPKTPEQAVERARLAHREISEQMRALLPKKPELKPTPPSGSSSSTAPAPRSLRDAVDRALG